MDKILSFFLTTVIFITLFPFSGQAAPKCLIFVHGHRTDQETVKNYHAVESYWIGKETNKLGMESGPVRDGVAAATRNGYHHAFLVGYDATDSYFNGAVEVSKQIERAMQGLPDLGGTRSCPVETEGAPTQYIVVAHSMGGVVMDYILGNAVPSSPYYNYKGAPFDKVTSKISYVMTVGTPHIGTAVADLIMQGSHNMLLNVLTWAFSHPDHGTEWLQTLPNYQVSHYMSAPLREVRLYTGWNSMGSSLLLRGNDDGVSSVATAFACNGDPNANRRIKVRTQRFPFYDLPLCENSPMGHMGGFRNYSNMNWSEENHADQRRDIYHGKRHTQGVPGGSSCLENGSFLEEVACNAGQ